MSAAIDNYATWNLLLAKHGSPKEESPIGAGFWRLVSSKGHARPVATWFEDGAWNVIRHGLDEFDDKADRGRFLKFMEHAWPNLEAWSAEDYEAAIENGVWPDNVPAQPKAHPATPEIANPDITPPVGHNAPPENDRLDELVENLDKLVAEATKLAQGGAAKTQEEADAAANLKARIRDLRQLIVAEHKREKAPVLEKGKAIDARWFRHRDRADALERRLHEVRIAPFLIEQRRLADEARRAAEEARKAGKPEPEIPRVNAGAKGMKDGLRKRYTGTIADYDAFVAAVKDHEEVVSFMHAYAQKISANLHQIGANLEGLTVTMDMV